MVNDKACKPAFPLGCPDVPSVPCVPRASDGVPRLREEALIINH